VRDGRREEEAYIYLVWERCKVCVKIIKRKREIDGLFFDGVLCSLVKGVLYVGCEKRACLSSIDSLPVSLLVCYVPALLWSGRTAEAPGLFFFRSTTNPSTLPFSGNNGA
jgi:hypothetical protein